MDLWNQLIRTLRPPVLSTGPALGESTGPVLGSSTADLTPYSYAPTYSYTYQSSTGEVYALKEAGRALLENLDDIDGTTAYPNPDVIQRFRDLVEPK